MPTATAGPVLPSTSTVDHVHRYPDGRVKVHTSAKGLMTRRRALGAAGATAAAVASASLLPSTPVAADRSSPTQPVPRPIPGGIEAPPIDFIHWWLPGPTDAVTPVIGLPGFGLDADPSTITDFYGFTAYAVVAGESTSHTGVVHPTEVDVRVMDGVYLDEGGTVREGAYAFL